MSNVAARRQRDSSTSIANVPRRKAGIDSILSQPNALDRDVEIDDSIVVDVDLAVVIEITVEPGAGSQRRVEIDPAVVVDVDRATQVGVAGVGELDQDRRRV